MSLSLSLRQDETPSDTDKCKNKNTDSNEKLWSAKVDETLFSEALFPPEYYQENAATSNSYWPTHSGKLAVLDELLRLCQRTRDKVVVASHYTQTLDLIERLCRACDYRYLRLDGSTDSSLRHNIVHRFQNESSIFIFLLSAKAGGFGLNLYAANRLILYDIDWNPVTDAQTTARIWRDGQKKPCFIYRLLTTGTLEEKIFQRQIMKQTLSRTIVDEDRLAQSFTEEMLHAIFMFKEETECETHDLVKCLCSGAKEDQRPPHSSTKTTLKRLKRFTEENIASDEVAAWSHLSRHHKKLFKDPLLRESTASPITFVFTRQTNPKATEQIPNELDIALSSLETVPQTDSTTDTKKTLINNDSNNNNKS